MQIAVRAFCLSLAACALLAGGSTVAQETAPTPAPAKPTSNMRRAIEWKRFDYTCEDGAKVTVYLHDETVKVRFKDNTYLMKQTSSADGGRYSDGKVVWWSVGNGGFLQEDTAEGNGAMIAKDCKLDQSVDVRAAGGMVNGTVGYLQRIALPPNALIIVQLQDVTLADAAATMIAEDKITLGNRQVPVKFSLKFDPAKIDQKHTYSVSARILVDGQLRFINDESYQVLTRGNARHADLLLKQVPFGAPAQP